MERDELRVIPGYEKYVVSRNGTIISTERNLVLKNYLLNGYLIVDTFRGSLTETLPVHRAVALAWVDNPNPEKLTVVNHLDGDPTNNWFKNLEWTDYSGNNYHAVNNGLRLDNIPCKVRDFYTKEVTDFSSMAQAKEFIGLPKDSPIWCLYPKMFGKLVADRYEFRFADDPNPWFYEERSELIVPSRYMVTVKSSNGSTREIYSTVILLKEYQLYGAKGRSIPKLAEYGNEKYSNLVFEVRDSYTEPQFRLTRRTNLSVRMPIVANKQNEQKHFNSLTQCANYFKVDRSSIQNRLNNGKELNGWTFIQPATCSSNVAM